MTKFIDERGDVSPRDGLTVYLNPLRELQEMWGGIEPDPIAGSLKDRREKCGGRPFAVSPADQDGWKLTVWISNCLKKPLDILETQLHAVTLEPIEIGNRLGIGHIEPTEVTDSQDFERPGGGSTRRFTTTPVNALPGAAEPKVAEAAIDVAAGGPPGRPRMPLGSVPPPAALDPAASGGGVFASVTGIIGIGLVE